MCTCGTTTTRCAPSHVVTVAAQPAGSYGEPATLVPISWSCWGQELILRESVQVAWPWRGRGVARRGKKRQPRLEFSRKQIKNGGARKVCRTCAAVVDKAALDGGTPGNSCLVHTVSSSVCSAFVQLSFSFRRVPDQLSGCCSLPACRDGLSWVARDALLHLCLDFHRGADLFRGMHENVRFAGD